MTNWYENDEFWELVFPVMFSESHFEKAVVEIDDVLGITGMADRDSSLNVLDLACGPGRHSIPLAKRGNKVCGVDKSAFLLAAAQEKAGAGDGIEWVQDDMRTFSRPASFDIALCMWTSFGYFEDPADDQVVLNNIYANLKPGGAFLLDVVGKEWIVRNIEPVHLTEFDDDLVLVERPCLSHELCRMSNEWTLIKQGQVYNMTWEHSLYTARELRDRFAIAGFEAVRVYGGLDGCEYDLDAERLVVCGFKPG